MSNDIGFLAQNGLQEGGQVAFDGRAETTLAPVHPGEILSEEFLKPLGLGTTVAAKRMGVPRTRIERLVRCEMGVSTDTALRLERLLGASAEFWLNLQQAYDLAVARDQALSTLANITPLQLKPIP
jgi:addiction module HigA family antidote